MLVPSKVKQPRAFLSLALRRAHIGPVPAFREMKIQGEIALKNDDFMYV
jgi:hypothetical protein